jgi:hypothetical protein
MKEVTSYYNIGSCAGVGKRGSRIQASLISLIIRARRCVRVSGMIQIIAHHIHTVVQNGIIILHSYKTASFFFSGKLTSYKSLYISATPIKVRHDNSPATTSCSCYISSNMLLGTKFLERVEGNI